MNTATAVFEAHHAGFRVTVRDPSGFQLAHETGLTATEVGALVTAQHVPAAAVRILAAQA